MRTAVQDSYANASLGNDSTMARIQQLFYNTKSVQISEKLQLQNNIIFGVPNFFF